MKVALSIGCLALFFASCQKDLSVKEDSKSLSVSSDALLPLPCHSTSFITDYPVVAGKVPPFKFIKTLYSDTRVKTIQMFSRMFPIWQTYLPYGIELNGQFSYGPNRAYLKGSRKVWVHYNFGNGEMKRLMSTKNVNLKFYLNAQGYCYRVTDLDRSQGVEEYQEAEVLAVNFQGGEDPTKISTIYVPEDAETQTENRFYYPVYDQYGNVLTYDRPYNRWAPYLTYTYDYTKPRGTKNYSFIPSQNWFNQEYSLLEVMQWLPQSNHQRKSVAASFFPYAIPTYPFNTGEKIVQSQVYKNFQFDSKGNQTSVTYGDNVPQRTTWYCK